MKPHEEIWEAPETEDGPLGILRFPGGWNVDLTGGGRVLECEERAKLAACAPEMARLLLALRDDPQSGLSGVDIESIEAVLRKAGVLP